MWTKEKSLDLKINFLFKRLFNPIKPIILCLFFTQCDQSTVNLPPTTDREYANVTQQSFDSFCYNLNLSAANIFVELCQSDASDVNQVVSPLSIQLAMAMLLNGAHQNTAAELKQLLMLESETIGGINSHFAELGNKVKEINSETSYLNLSNAAIWHPAIAMNTSFLNRIEQSYSADVLDNNFTVEGVNNWAEAATDGLIKEVIQEIIPDEVLFLLNALLYRGDWLSSFEKDAIQLVTTELPYGTLTEYEMMASDYKHFYYENEEIKAINMKFTSEAYEMVVKSNTQAIAITRSKLPE